MEYFAGNGSFEAGMCWVWMHSTDAYTLWMETIVAHLEYACLGVLHSIQDRINVCILFRTRQAFPSTCSSCKLTSLDVNGQPG